METSNLALYWHGYLGDGSHISYWQKERKKERFFIKNINLFHQYYLYTVYNKLISTPVLKKSWVIESEENAFIIPLVLKHFQFIHFLIVFIIQYQSCFQHTWKNTTNHNSALHSSFFPDILLNLLVQKQISINFLSPFSFYPT